MYYNACVWYRRQRLRRATLTQGVIALEKSLNLSAALTSDTQLLESVNCPDCSDTMLKFYDWDEMRYLCENCGLIIDNLHSYRNNDYEPGYKT